jgi:hypothetical protein
LKPLIAKRWLIVAAGLIAALPVIVSTVRVVAAGWVPDSDQAIITTRAYDVLTSLTPLVGAWSSASATVGENIYYAGPLLYWLLALPARLPVDAAFPVAMGAVNTAAVMGAVALANRRGGRPLMFASAAAIPLMCASLRTHVLSDIWASTAALMLMPLLFFACWSLACGDYRLLPLMALVASFAMQGHLVFLLPTIAAVAVGLGGLILVRRAAAREAPAPDARSLRRWATAGLIVFAVCWSAPLVDQGLAWAGSPRGHGNLVNLVDAAGARDRPAGAKAGAYSLVRAEGIPPWWLRPPSTEAARTFDIFARPGALAFVSTALMLLGVVSLTAAGWRRGRMDVAAAGVLTLALNGSLAVVTASFPNTHTTIFSYGYTSLWASPLGMWTWLMLGWSAATLYLGRLRLCVRRAPPFAPAAALAAVAVVAVAVATGQGPIRDRANFRATARAIDRLDAALPKPGLVRVRSFGLALETAVIDDLRRHGGDVRVDRDVGVQLEPIYSRRERRYDEFVEIRPAPSVPAGTRTVAVVRFPTSSVPVALTLRAGGSAQVP